MKKGALKGIVCLVVIVVIWMAVSFRSKPLSDRSAEEPYLMMIRYDSETEGRYESLACWEGGRIDFRDTAYMITGKEKTKATDLLEALLQEYETAE